jgi:hypothetical protein
MVLKTPLADEKLKKIVLVSQLKAAHQRKFDIIVFWALDRLTREGARATLNYLQRLESKGVGYFSYQEQWLDSTDRLKMSCFRCSQGIPLAERKKVGGGDGNRTRE